MTSIACAFRKPVIIAPAMNCNMWDNPIVQENLNKLHYTILEPEAGIWHAVMMEKAGFAALIKF